MFYTSLSERLLHQHLALAQIIKPLAEEQLMGELEPGKWSVHENMAHLVSYQPQFLSRLHRILDSQDPFFDRYIGDDDPAFLYWRRQSPGTLLKELEADRQQIIQLLESLNNEQLQRTGIHASYGRLNIEEWTEFFLLHEAHHLLTIFKLVHKAKQSTVHSR